MSLALVYEFAQDLPPRLRESVIGYARSVQNALPDKEWTQLRDLLNDLEIILAQQRIQEMMFITSYSEILQRLRDER